jgi:GntR family transcriptional regulator/MocR family aminotransferase
MGGSVGRASIADRSAVVTAAAISLDRAATTPMYRQIYDNLREAILDGRLAGRSRLPSTRALALELGIARSTVANAYEQLLAEGYVDGQIGSGTYVAPVLPDDVLNVARKPSVAPVPSRSGRGLSHRGAMLAATPVSAVRGLGGPVAFRHGLPAFDAFPYDLWARLVARRWRQPPSDLVGYGSAAGYTPLREAIAAYLAGSRGVRCVPEQVIVVSGSQQALDLSVRVLLDEGDVAWIEDPGYLGARGAFTGAGASVVPVPVDAEGIDLATAGIDGSTPRMIYVSPSHQFPLGVTMSLGRRLALLESAERHGAWILEDDYDSEYRYAGRPLAALQGLDRGARVIYLGTFSKVLLPGLRLGYLVVPADLVDAFVAARALADRHSPSVEQAVVADFIAEGHFARHVRRMRSLYAERQRVLVDAASRDLAGLLDVRPSDAGMHLIGWLPSEVDDARAAQRVLEEGVDVIPLSRYRLRTGSPGGLVLGYTAIDEEQIRAGVRRLATALDRR